MEKYDVIVVGAGHAGSESAYISSKLGCNTLLLALNLDSIAFLACNPSIGGTSKGNIVQEIDALGGIMAKIADKSILHIRMLNEGKGPAVQSLRAQVDKHKYHLFMKDELEKQDNLTIKQAEVKNILVKENKILGIETTFGQRFYSKTVIIATGVYQNSAIIVGKSISDNGPAGFCNSKHLSNSLRKMGFELRRFKTGTPPRIDAKSINFSCFERQPTNLKIYGFSAFAKEKKYKEKDCFLGYTNNETKNIILKNLNKAPMYSGKIKGTGARYCPSIEDKMVRFKDKERHQIFLEPEADGTCEIYLQGLSTSFPAEIQEKIVRSIRGLENAKIMRNAYAIEYDCIDPLELKKTLESKRYDNLFFAGQINGTSGYEEAAGQGIVAGINAALKVKNKPPFILNRSESYIGVLIDDLVTKGTNEPYRMMTSRAEYRLMLRTDNVLERLYPLAIKYDLQNEENKKLFYKREKLCEELRRELKNTKISASSNINKKLEELGQRKITQNSTIEELIKRGIEIEFFEKEFKRKYSYSVLKHVEIEIRYSGYIEQQKIQIEKEKQQENTLIPNDFDYLKISGLRLEAKQKLNQIKPITIGQASRISGVTPADITVLLIKIAQRG